MRVAALAATLLLFAGGANAGSAAVWRIGGATLLIDVPLAADNAAEPVATLAFDGNAAYLSAPDGLYTLDRLLTAGSLTRIAFAGDPVRNAYIHDGALYVLKMTREAAGTSTDHGFFRSTDGGSTFTALDANLYECVGGYCRYLSAGEAAFADDRIVLNAGGNVLVTDDDGGSWHALRGSIQQQACYDPTFALDGSRLFVGGECPLDVAYVLGGTLDESGVAWMAEPAPLKTPELENRKIQFIRRRASTDTWFIGTEGGLLKSTDDTATFDWSLFRAIDSTIGYPYVAEILFPSSVPDGVIVAGFDKATMEPWIAISSDGGAHWYEGSSALRKLIGFEHGIVAFIVEDPAGRIVAGLLDEHNQRLGIAEIHLAKGGRARGVPR